MEGIVLRPLRAGERGPVLEVFAGLSERSRRLRFLGSKPRLLESDVRILVDVLVQRRDGPDVELVVRLTP